MTTTRTKFTICQEGAGLLANKHTPGHHAGCIAVATVLAHAVVDAQCLADYIYIRVLESNAHLLTDHSARPQLLRAAVRRFVHTAYKNNTSIEAYPPVPEYLSNEGEDVEGIESDEE